jgi:hypothetical protein
MHGDINWGGGTRWEAGNATDLCEGTADAEVRIRCFQQKLEQGQAWQAAIAACNSVPSVAGNWVYSRESYTGIYTMSQDGAKFRYTMDLGEGISWHALIGTGTITGNTLAGTELDTRDYLTDPMTVITGVVVQADSDGRAQRIEWQTQYLQNTPLHPTWVRVPLLQHVMPLPSVPGHVETRIEADGGAQHPRGANFDARVPTQSTLAVQPSTGGAPPASIAGQWNSNIGSVFDIAQSGGDFSWTVGSNGQRATGTINGDRVTASWADQAGQNQGSGTGAVTTDANGVAQQIAWDNSVIFSRAPATRRPERNAPIADRDGGPVRSSPGAPAGGFRVVTTLPMPSTTGTASVASVSGQWNSNIGLVYDIVQSGADLSWTVSSNGQRGSGKIDGDRVTATWTDQAGQNQGSGAGTVTKDASGVAQQIAWDNGVIFSRAQAAGFDSSRTRSTRTGPGR